jgi:hypothetical protein
VATHLEPSGVSDLANDSDLADDAVGPPSHSRTWQPTPATFIWLFALAWGLRIGLQPLSDNSLLTHIATGRIIFDTGFPHSDPYLLPARTSWVVQSTNSVGHLLEPREGVGHGRADGVQRRAHGPPRHLIVRWLAPPMASSPGSASSS